MADYLDYNGSIFVVGEPVEDRFCEFQLLVEELGLSTFVAFFTHKLFNHSNFQTLSTEQMEMLMTDCQPLIQEALIQQRAHN